MSELDELVQQRLDERARQEWRAKLELESSGSWLPRKHRCRLPADGERDDRWKCQCGRKYSYDGSRFEPIGTASLIPLTDAGYFRVWLYSAIVILTVLLVLPVILMVAVHIKWVMAYITYLFVAFFAHIFRYG